MGRKRRKRSTGGFLVGPSHEQGGIPAYVPGQPPIELEGSEFIINAKTVNAVGVDFLEKLNRTQSPYHSQPGFSRGQLPGSKFRNGGSIRRNNMRRRRKFGHGGMMRNGNGCPPGMHMMPDGSCMEGAYHGALPGQYRRGGRVRRQMGGRNSGLASPWGGRHNHRK